MIGVFSSAMLAKKFSLRVWFAVLWLAVVLLGLGIALYVMPYGFGWFAGAIALAIVAILLIVPNWLR